MSKNPVINSLSASAYIVLVASVMFWGTKMNKGQDSIIAPIAIISLFTLSAAVMGYLFCYQPLMLYIDGKKKQAVNLFLQTLVLFASITVLALVFLFTGAFS
jgi:hypothetical protein